LNACSEGWFGVGIADGRFVAGINGCSVDVKLGKVQRDARNEWPIIGVHSLKIYGLIIGVTVELSVEW
jgi:hypothetical protein